MTHMPRHMPDRLVIAPEDFTDVTYEVRDGVATVMLARPEARNGYTVRMGHELASAMRLSDSDDDVRVVVLGAQGSDFCVGADLSAGGFESVDGSGSGTGDAPGLDDPEHPDFVEPAGRCTREMATMTTPVIAAVQGRAVGAGSTVILPADIRVAAEDAKFGYVFTRRGIVAEGASSWWLPRIVGLPRATEWLVTGRVISATEALEAGLVTRLVPVDDVLATAREIAEEIAAATAPVAVALTKRMLQEVSHAESPADAHAVDSAIIAHALTSPDAIEGVTSFFEKRTPSFPGKVSTDLPTGIPWPSERTRGHDS